MADERTTFCRICENQCGLRVTVEGDRIAAIRPDDAHVATRGYACIKGLTFENVRTSRDRVTTPLKRTDAGFVPISWEQAFAEIGAKVREIRSRHGDDSVGVYFGNPPSFSIPATMFINAFGMGLNTAKLFNTGSLDCNNKFAVSQQMFGSPMALTFPDLNEVRLLVIVGANPVVSKGTFVHVPAPARQLKEIEARGGRIVHVNPRFTESAKAAGDHLPIRPGTDVFFLLAFLNEVIARDGIRHDIVAAHMNGFAELAAVAEQWSAERQAEVTGISATQLRELVAAYLAADGAALYAATGLNQGGNGTLAFWILEAINAVTGNLDRRGGSLMGRGIVNFAKVAARTKYREFRSRIGDIPSFLGALPMALLADEILEPGSDRIRAMFVVSGNPQLTGTNSTRTAQALDALDLLVCVDMFRSETAEHADYILPGLHFSERPDIPFFFYTFGGLMPTPWFQYTDRLVAPPGECRDETWIMARLGKACGAPLFGSRLFQALLDLGEWLKRAPLVGRRLLPANERMLQMIARFGGQGGLARLRRHPHGRRLAPNRPGDYLGKRVLTADGKVALATPALLELAAARLLPAFEQARENLGELLLITKRERYTHNSWTHNDPAFVKGRYDRNYLYINPADADGRGLADGETVRIAAAAGSVTAQLSFCAEMMPGSVALPHGWGHQSAVGLGVASQTSGVNANILAPDGPAAIEPLSGMAQFNGIPVKVMPAQSHPQVLLCMDDAQARQGA